jgi:hypothetical protein
VHQLKILVFKFYINTNLILAFEIPAYKTYLLFQKYAPALDLELKIAITPSIYKIKTILNLWAMIQLVNYFL